MYKNNRGFTLIEMLVVLMIISILIILVVPNLGDKTEYVQGKGCDALVSVVQAQVDAYRLETGDYPTSLDELVSKNYITETQKTCSNNAEISYSNGLVSAPLINNE